MSIYMLLFSLAVARVLVVVPSIDDAGALGDLLSGADFYTPESSPPLFLHEKRMYNHLIHLAPKSTLPKVIDFMKEGGNALISFAEGMTSSHQRLAHQFGLHFAGSVSGNFTSSGFLGKFNVNYTGIGHLIHEDRKDWIITLLASDKRLVSVVQSINNARFAAIGTRLLDNEFYKSLIKWVFKDSYIVRAKNIQHNLLLLKGNATDYRVNDKIKYSAELEELIDGKYVPFRTNKLQLTLKMLDPVLRFTLPESYAIEFEAPEKVGVYTFDLSLRVPGYSFISHQCLVPIQQPKHDSFPRFLFVAYPYYVVLFGQIGLLVVFSALFLSHKDKLSAKKTE